MTVKYTHPHDCADHKAAAADRKTHAALTKEREERQQVAAHKTWFDWYAPRPRQAHP